METVIVSAMPLLCGRLPPIAVNILSKDFSASSEILMSLGVALKSLPLSLNSIKL